MASVTARIPVRTCIGCRGRAAKTELVRITATSGDHGTTVATVDLRGAAQGRGAHLHPSTACFDLAVRRRAFGRALRVPDGIDVAPVRQWLASLDTDQAAPDRRDWSSSS